jgi:hypothetical protein
VEASDEQAISGGAGQYVVTVRSAEEGLATFAFADAAGDGGDRMGASFGFDPVILK